MTNAWSFHNLPVTTGPANSGFFAMADEDILITLE
jgi:hypothetical protein